MSKQGLVFPTLILLLCLTTICRAQKNTSLCISSFCGDINISYPFRLRTDPANCGHHDPIFTLHCQQNQTIFSSKSGTYHVQEINYSKFTIRISDPGLDSRNYSSCPIYSTSDYDLSTQYMYSFSSDSIYVTFLNCRSQVNNPLYVENTFCANRSAFSNSSRIYGYLTVDSILVSDLEESCTYDKTVEALPSRPLKDGNFSYSEIHDLMAYGFELTWYPAMCTDCDPRHGTCVLEDDKIRCRHYCFESTPFEERTFLCKLEFYAIYLYLAALALAALIGLRFILGIPFLIGLVVCKLKRRDSSMKKSEIIEELTKHQMNFMPINYSYAQIKKMTSNFKAKLGEGTRGTVFKGKLQTGPLAAVKMLTNSSSSDKEFIIHLSAISKICHPNVTKIIGFCIKGTKRAIVHEFIPHGSLDKHMIAPSLSYKEMFKISLGVARGITCLHDIKLSHLGIKPQNILLDQDLNPKISDCGLAKLYSSDDHRSVGDLKPGKMGFIAPELLYRNIGEISCKADVYSFGMLVLEMAAGLKSLYPSAEKSGAMYFPSWIYKQLSEGEELRIRDAEEEDRKMVKKMIVVALWCIQIRAEDRPLMHEVVAMLQGEEELLQMPPIPFRRGVDDDDDEIMENV